MYTKNSGIPSFNKNAAMQLVVAYGSCFVVYHLIRVVLLIAGANPSFFPDNITSNIALPVYDNFFHKIWTVLTYGWVHNGFWELFSNMVWLYVFGSVTQLIIGYRQIIPLFVYSLVIGAFFYEFSQFLPGDSFVGRSYMIGAQAGIISLAVAAITSAPNYRYHLTQHFSIPLVVIVIIFFVLAIINSGLEGAAIFLLVGGAATGFTYVILLKKGYNLGGWYHNMFDYLNKVADPKPKEQIFGKKGIVKSLYGNTPGDNNNLDRILDKVNEKGFDALSKEEKAFLLKASKGED